MTPREEELQIEIERLTAWLVKIHNEAWKEASIETIETLAHNAVLHSNAAAHVHWPAGHNWAPVGKWPPKHIETTNL